MLNSHHSCLDTGSYKHTSPFCALHLTLCAVRSPRWREAAGQRVTRDQFPAAIFPALWLALCVCQSRVFFFFMTSGVCYLGRLITDAGTARLRALRRARMMESEVNKWCRWNENTVSVVAALKVKVVYQDVEAVSWDRSQREHCRHILIPAVLLWDPKFWEKERRVRRKRKKTASRDSSAPLFRSRGRPPTDEFSTHELTHFPQPHKCAGRCLSLHTRTKHVNRVRAY